MKVVGGSFPAPRIGQLHVHFQPINFEATRPKLGAGIGLSPWIDSTVSLAGAGEVGRALAAHAGRQEYTNFCGVSPRLHARR